MPSFAELQKNLTDARHRKLVIMALVEYIDATFRPIPGREEERKVLMDDNNLEVPLEAFDSFITEVLNPLAQESQEEVDHILKMEIPPPALPAQPAPAPVPVQTATPPATTPKKRGKKVTPPSTTEGESK